MNIRFSILILLIFVFASLSVFAWIYLKNQSITNLEEAYLFEPEIQDKTERVWVDIDFDLAVKDTVSMFAPFRLISDNDNYFYAADLNNFEIKNLDESGTVVQHFGKGEGRGPGEFLTIGGLQLNTENQLWVADERNGRITIFEKDGSWTIHQPRQMPSRVISLDDENYVLRNRFNSQLFISSLNDTTFALTSPYLNEEGSLWAYVMQPILIETDNSFLRINYYTNDFVKYDRNGRIIYFRKNINHLDLADLRIDPPKRYEDEQDVQFNEVSRPLRTPMAIDAHRVHDQVHILTTQFVNDSLTIDTVDVYELNTGDYVFSYTLPEAVYAFAISNNTVATISRDEQIFKIWDTNKDLIRFDYEEYELHTNLD